MIYCGRLDSHGRGERSRSREERSAKLFVKMINKVFFGDLKAEIDWQFDIIVIKEFVKHCDQQRRSIVVPLSIFEPCPIELNLNSKRALKEIHSFFWSGIFPYEQIKRRT